MTRERLDKGLQRGIVGLAIAVLVVGPLATGAARASDFLILQGLVMLAVALWLVRLWLAPGGRLLWPPICWVVAAFTVYAIVRYHQAELEYVARKELTRVIVYALFFAVVLNHAKRQEFTRAIVYVLVFLGMAISLYAVYQVATGSDRVWHFIRPEAYAGRGSGTYICPNHLAGFLGMTLPLGIACVIMGRMGVVLRLFLGYASVAMVAGLGVSLSRGGWVAAGLGVGVLLAMAVRRRQHRIPVLVLLVLLVAGTCLVTRRSMPAQERVSELFEERGPQQSFRARASMWHSGYRMWQDHFWWGAGPGHFDFRFPAYRSFEMQRRPGYAHNDYLNALADWGLVGATMVAGAFVLLYWGAWRTLRYVRRDEDDLAAKRSSREAFVTGAAAGLVAMLAHSFTDFNMQIPANALVAIGLMALLSAHLRFTSNRYWLSPGVAGRVLISAALGLALVHLGQEGWRRAGESRWLARAARERTYSAEKLEALKRAWTIEPGNFETAFAMGEALRQLSWQGETGYRELAEESISWFERGMAANPHDAYFPLRIGMCLVWLDRMDEAKPHMERALALDPNNHYLQLIQGWYYLCAGDDAEARRWFQRSIQTSWQNPIARAYLRIVETRLRAAARE